VILCIQPTGFPHLREIVTTFILTHAHGSQSGHDRRSQVASRYGKLVSEERPFQPTKESRWSRVQHVFPSRVDNRQDNAGGVPWLRTRCEEQSCHTLYRRPDRSVAEEVQISVRIRRIWRYLEMRLDQGFEGHRGGCQGDEDEPNGRSKGNQDQDNLSGIEGLGETGTRVCAASLWH